MKEIDITDCIGKYIIMDGKVQTLDGYNYKDDTVKIYFEEAYPEKNKMSESIMILGDNMKCMIGEDKVFDDLSEAIERL